MNRFAVTALAAIVIVGTFGVAAGVGAGSVSGPGPVPTMVFLARSDVPVDALGGGALAGSLGASVLITARDRLESAPRDALVAIAPDLVVLLGGLAALSEQVEADVEALGFPVRRIAGEDRASTAAALAMFAAEIGAGRPVLTDRPVTDGTVPGLDAELLQGQTPGDIRDGLQNRVDGTCSVGSAIRAVAADGSVTCQADGDTTYSPGFGLSLTGTTFNVDTTAIQQRVEGSCVAGQYVRAIAADGSVTCQSDANTTYTAGTGLTLTGTTFDVNTTSIQSRVTGTCAARQAIRVIASTGSVTCQPVGAQTIAFSVLSDGSKVGGSGVAPSVSVVRNSVGNYTLTFPAATFGTTRWVPLVQPWAATTPTLTFDMPGNGGGTLTLDFGGTDRSFSVLLMSEGES